MISASRYAKYYEESLQDTEHFWLRQAAKLSWTKQWDEVLDDSSAPFYKWFPGGRINVCYNLLDRHVLNGKGDKIAIYYDSAFTKEKEKLSFKQLHQKVSKLGTVMLNLGVTKGSVVVICLPRIPELLIAILACARIGAVYCLMYGGVPPKGLGGMMKHAQPSLIVTTSFGMLDKLTEPVFFKEVLDEAVELAGIESTKFLVIERLVLPEEYVWKEFQMFRDRDYYWDDDLLNGAEESRCVPMDLNEPLHISYTSGTTGQPKGVVMSAARLLLTAAREEMDSRGTSQDALFFSPKELSVTPAHFNLLYRPFYSASAALLYEGDISGENSLDLLRLVDQYKITYIVTSFRSFTDLKEQVEMIGEPVPSKQTSLKVIEVGGEVNDSSLMYWLANFFRCAVSSGYGQTETGTAIAKAVFEDEIVEEVIPIVKQSILPTSGFSVKVVSSSGVDAKVGEQGRLLLRTPLPPGTLTTLWRNDARYVKDYFTEYPGYYDTKDYVVVEEGDAFRVTGRADDAILVAGARIMPSLIEDVIRSHPMVLDCFVGPVPDEKYGEVPYAWYTTEGPTSDEIAQETEIIDTVNKTLGEVIRFRGASRVLQLPRTTKEKMQRHIVKDYFKNGTVTKVTADVKE